MPRSLPTRPSRAPALVALCLIAAACTPEGGPTSLEGSVPVPRGPSGADVLALASERPTRGQPIVTLPPAAGAVRDVRVHPYADGLRQEVALAGGAYRPVHDAIIVLARTSTEPTLEERVPLAPPTEAGIRSEIGAQFPHLAMQVVERPSANAFGPYGLALGRAGGDARCLYAWQWIDANRLPPGSGIAGPVSLRVRLCQADTSFDAMAALVDHLAVAAAPDARVAAIDPVAVDPVAIEAAAAGGPRAAPRRAKRVARAASRPRARLARRVDAPPAPFEAASAQPRSVTAASTIPGASPPPFAVDLPPQALLGPTAGARAGIQAAAAANPH